MKSIEVAIEALAINTIRTLSMDAVQKANSGHPGTPMALAPVAYALWQRFLRFDPEEPLWPNRDRFILSAGHASMLLYSMLHLTGVKDTRPGSSRHGELAVTLEEIERFRQLDSFTPGHPEHELTAGVETTTGPLGQGVANSVGLAIAGNWLAARYNRPDLALFDYDVWVIASDGDLMEGISHEAASLAGHLRLPNLCWIYDHNHITIEGATDLACSDDVAWRFRGYGWNVIDVPDANDLDALTRAFEAFRATRDRPTLIVVTSHIGWGAPEKQDTAAAHGEPLGEPEVRAAKSNYGWPEEAHFRVPEGVREHFASGIGARGRDLRARWTERWNQYRAAHPADAAEVELMQRCGLPEGWDRDVPVFPADAKGMATREAGGKVLNAIAKHVPWLLGGSADLAPSTKTLLTFDGAGDFEAGSYGGRNLHFGIREHGMGGAMTGMSLAGLRPYGATFLIFSDYARPSIRLAALMRIPSIWVFTHDSIGLGEDGPSHQPIEQLPALRAIPGVVVIRPCDANETAEAWRVAMTRTDGPTALALSRQALPTLDRTRFGAAAGLARGAYILADPPGGGAPDLILIASGSEVSVALAAAERLATDRVRVRVVSMPSWELFAAQDGAYRESVLPAAAGARLAVEAAGTFGWERWIGAHGAVIGMTGFGASAPAKDLMKKFGFTPEHVAETARTLLG